LVRKRERMARKLSLEERIAERRPLLDILIRDFESLVRSFDEDREFVGPSIYFHVKGLEHLKRHVEPVGTLYDDLFFDYLYATLTSWGLNRMGPGKTKLGPISDLKASLQDQVVKNRELEGLRIDRLEGSEVAAVADASWQVMSGLQVSVAEVQLVANSKALHHVLPDLVPPIDRNYTLMFFVGRPYIYRSKEMRLFMAVFPLFHEIAVRCSETIHGFLTTPPKGMNTSVTKVIDNAILGLMPIYDRGSLNYSHA
jgi:hypothetical protein